MSRENVEIIRRHYEAFNRRDLDTAAQYHHPDIEVYPGAIGPDTDTGSRGRFGGRAEVREFFEALFNTWETVTVELEEIVEGGGDRVLGVEQWHTRGRGGIEVGTKIFDLYTFRDGLVVRVDGFLDKAVALRAAGLSEQDAHAESS
jgi:ketosteroid isomerase-like protein